MKEVIWGISIMILTAIEYPFLNNPHKANIWARIFFHSKTKKLRYTEPKKKLEFLILYDKTFPLWLGVDPERENLGS